MPTTRSAVVRAGSRVSSSSTAQDSLVYFSDPVRATAVCDSVATWFIANQRPLPWRPCPAAPSTRRAQHAAYTRLPRDPYGTWVCEVMSQQTRIHTVVVYWQRWMETFPTVAALAAADAEHVRSLWTGLGYYRRAALLHRGAQYVVSEHSGELPNNAKALCKVPGIGPYTAGAIASICFGERTLAVDGNVLRVLARLCGARDVDPKDARWIKIVCSWAERLLHHSSNSPSGGGGGGGKPHAGDVSEGFIELGATVCKPNGAPDCQNCPLSAHCSARQLLTCGDIESIDGTIPCRGSKTKVQQQTCVSIVHTAFGGSTSTSSADDVCWVLGQRPPTGLLANLYEFPNIVLEGSDVTDCAPTTTRSRRPCASSRPASIEDVLKRLSGTMVCGPNRKKVGARPKAEEDVPPYHSLGSFVHRFSHIHLTVHVVVVVHRSRDGLEEFTNNQSAVWRCFEHTDVRVVTRADMKHLGVAKTVEKIIDLVTSADLFSCGASKSKKAAGPTKRPRSA